MNQPNSLERFLKAQKTSYSVALNEIQTGRKRSHWMWYIFPQLRGLGESDRSWYYGIEDRAEAEAYLEDKVLDGRLREITQVLLALPETDPVKIFGYIDSVKLCSCMTLFAQVSPDDVFTEVLEKYYGGQEDRRTLELLQEIE